jgi:hypothetical protein
LEPLEGLVFDEFQPISNGGVVLKAVEDHRLRAHVAEEIPQARETEVEPLENGSS